MATLISRIAPIDQRSANLGRGRELALRSGDAREISIQLEHENVKPTHRLQLREYRAALLERPGAYRREVLRLESAAEFVQRPRGFGA